jgi:hypothetical protein
MDLIREKVQGVDGFVYDLVLMNFVWSRAAVDGPHLHKMMSSEL